jgi:signal transduction histidine kinase
MHPRIFMQVTMPALLISVLLLGTSAVGIWSLNRLQINRGQMVAKGVQSLEAAQELELWLRLLRFHSLLYMMDPTEDRRAPIEEDHREFEAALGVARRTALLPEEVELIGQIEEGYRLYRAELDRARPFSSQASLSEVLRWADEHPVRHLVTPSQELLNINRQAIEAAAHDSETVSMHAQLTLVLLGVLAPVGGLVAGFGVAWGLNRSITRLSVRLQDVQGQLDRDLGSVRLKGEGDWQHLDRQLEHVFDRVREVVSQLHRQQQEMLRATQLAAVGQLASGIAHELRNPLAGVKLLVGAALHSRPPRRLTEQDLRVIHEEIARVERKVQDLLDFARPPELKRRSRDLRDLTKSALDLVAARAEHQNVALDVTLPDAPVCADVDADQLTGVLVNLFLNALDAMPGGGRLTVLLEGLPPASARLCVRDSGSGIDPNVLGKLFAPFTSTKATGTGLGLHISRRVAEQHGGSLVGENHAQGGACFTVTIPILNGEASHADHPARG